jgi:SAM-dependent methyltransferase
MSNSSFDDLTDLYEAMIDWPKRLANEAPFFRRLFEQSKVARVADVACGTGRHADMFRSWGLEVHGSDISPSMIQRAKEAFGESEQLCWKVQGFEHPVGPPGFFDAVVCIGNSLALAPDATTAAQALCHMLQGLRPGGLAIVHVLNLWKLPQGPCVWQKIINTALAQGESLILKGVHRCSDRGYVELVVISNGKDGSPIRSRAVPFLGLKSKELEATARENGAVDVTFFGNHQNQPYDGGNSTDMIMVAKKGEIES